MRSSVTGISFDAVLFPQRSAARRSRRRTGSAALHQASKMSTYWQSIETAPLDGTPVLLLHRMGRSIARWDGTWWRPMTNDYRGIFEIESAGAGAALTAVLGPSHWMLLPAPPEGV